MRLTTTLGMFLALAGCAVAADDEVPGMSKGGKTDTGTSPPLPGDDASPDDTGADPTDSGEPVDTSVPPTDSGAPSGDGGGTGFSSAKEMFDHVNATRAKYATHIPYDGYPFTGVNAASRTWALTLTWDDGLAAEAQAEANAVAGGAKPKGTGFPYQPPNPGEGMYLFGIDSARYVVTAMSSSSTLGKDGGGWTSDDPGKWHLTSNGMYRQAVAYQTGSSSFNKRTKLGVGMADAGSGNVFWVLVFSQ